jgi:hypothetical protein
MSKYAKPKPTVAQHVELGRQVIAARNTINEVLGLFARDSRYGRAAWTIYRKLDTVRSGLDSAICDLTARSDPRNLAPTVYYGKGLMPDPNTAHTSTTKDAFAGWKRATDDAAPKASMTPITAMTPGTVNL